ncbi:NAD-dependent epimerase/dehydratase family protein [Thiocapsa sp.]|uniref:NAD-dependent epimerase/dehydratase family protein n=1 Tax=Thiocapsa sp. TaxID=2024551 RepID=UPI0034577B21
MGLRYFNVFGPRQDPDGAYAAVIPKWTAALINGDDVFINGDGDTSRDFCYIDNAVQANLLAATATKPGSRQPGLQRRRRRARHAQRPLQPDPQPTAAALSAAAERQPIHRDFRPGDVRHSLADITKAATRLGYAPTHRLEEGLEIALPWYSRHT